MWGVTLVLTQLKYQAFGSWLIVNSCLDLRYVPCSPACECPARSRRTFHASPSLLVALTAAGFYVCMSYYFLSGMTRTRYVCSPC